MPLFKKKIVIGAKLEATLGTAETITAAEAAFFGWEADIVPTVDKVARPYPGAFSELAAAMGARMGTATFKVDLHGSGTTDTAPTWANTLLPACGLVPDSGTITNFILRSLAPAGSATDDVPHTVTIAMYEDGRRKAIYGAMGNVKFVLDKAGVKGYAEFEFMGIWVEPTDATLLAPTMPSIIPPAVRGCTCTVATLGLTTDKIEIDLGNQVSERPDVTAASGYGYYIITDRQPTVTLSREAVLLATQNHWADFTAGTTRALAIALGGATWNKLEWAAPAAQVDDVKSGDRNGLITDDLTFALRRSAANDDELTLNFTSGS